MTNSTKQLALNAANGVLFGLSDLPFNRAVVGAIASEVLSVVMLDGTGEEILSQSIKNILASLAGWATVRTLRSR